MVLLDPSAPDPARSRPPSTNSPAVDAFISYSHASDREFAPAIHRALERIGKPWYRRRARTIYLDATGLEVTDKLWGTISGVLARARFLVLLCSPGAAKSDYVDQEIRFWLEHHGSETVLVVLTDGTWVWDDETGRLDVEKSTSVPPALSDAFTEPPRYLDLTWARDDTTATLRNAAFRNDIAALAAPISGRSKAEIEGDDLREHRRTVRTARAAAVTLAILLVCALIAALFATINATEAARQRDVATSRLLSMQSSTRADRDPQLATLLALAASEVSPTPEATGAMLTMAEQDSSVVGYLPGHRAQVEAAAISPDGRTFLTAGPADPVRLWDADSREVRAELPANVVAAAEFSPDGRSVAVSDGGGVTVWDVDARIVRSRIDVNASSLAFSADGMRLLLGSFRGEVVVVDAASGAEVRRLPGLTAPTSGAGFSPDGRFVSAGDWSGTLLLWDLASGAEITRTRDYPVRTKGDAAFGPDNRTFAASRNRGDVLLLDLATLTWQQVFAHEQTVTNVVYLDADTLVTAARDGSVGRWSIPTSNSWEEYVEGPVSPVAGVAIGPDGRTVLAGDFTGNAVVWRMGQTWARPRGTPAPTGPGAVDPATGRSAITSADGTTVEVVDAGRSFRVPLPGRASSVSLRSEQLAIGFDDGSVAIFSSTNGVPLRAFRMPQPRPVDAVDLSPDGRLLAAGDRAGDVAVWSAADGTQYAQLPTPNPSDTPVDIYTQVAFSPDGRTLAHSSLGGGLRLWDVPSRTAGATLEGPSPIGTSSLAFGPGGRLAQGGMDGKIVLWDPARPEAPTGVLTGQRYAVTGMSFGADDRLAAGSDQGGGVTIWNVRTGTRDAVLRPDTGYTEPFFLDGSTLLITDRTGGQTYDLTPDALRARLCAIAGGDLSPDEWSSYVEGREQSPVCEQVPR
ncbi:TIR domain-containing protein [Actinomycetospora sp. OC33-EN08]|uniref:TIR domain-containing protein n=1 Tax=Actinomycetospora aurantiaca TaxID=3129233 RepID=A0ABU8MI59_9PSEU